MNDQQRQPLSGYVELEPPEDWMGVVGHDIIIVGYGETIRAHVDRYVPEEGRFLLSEPHGGAAVSTSGAAFGQIVPPIGTIRAEVQAGQAR